MLLCTAIFTVSFARWNVEGGVTSVPAQGSVGKFYVDYPYYASSSDGTIVPDLKSGIYYLQVQKSDGMSDYYAMEDNPGNSAEKMLTHVYLKANTTLDMYKGTTRDQMKNKKDGSADQFVHPSNNTPSTATVDATGYYDFYYEYNYNTMFVGYSESFVPVNPDDYNSYTFKIKFSDSAVPRTLHIKSTYVPYIYIWDSSSYYYSTSGYEAVDGYKYSNGISSNGGNPLTINQAGGRTIKVGKMAETNVIFDDQTAWGSNKTKDLNLARYASDTDNYIELQPTTSEYEPGLGALDYTEPTTTGSTTFSSTAKKENTDETVVRDVTASITADGGYTYHNYICVSRMGGTTETMAYVNFEVKAIGSTNLENVNVSGFSVTRTATDADGLPESGASGSGSTYFVYNSPAGGTLKDINPLDEDPDDSVQGSDHLLDGYIVGGTYIMLYFGTAENQYYALDIEIKTDKEASFKLTATATNIDKRNRFEDGYGFPYGYYLGGTFNGTGMWEPRKAARLTANHTSNATTEAAKSLTYQDNGVNVTFSGPTYIDVEIEIELTAMNDTVKLYRVNGKDGKYVDGSNPSLWFIPRSIHKNYSGGAGDGHSTLFDSNLNIIIRQPGKYRIRYVGSVQYKYYTVDGDDPDYNNGVRYYDRELKKYVSLNDYNNNYTPDERNAFVYDEVRNVYENRFVELGNWNGVVDDLYVTKLETGAIDEVTVTFDLQGGNINGNTTNPTETVKWGSTLSEGGTINKVPTFNGKIFDGWYDVEDGKTGGTLYTDRTVITTISATLTLYAHYTDASKPKYEVSFDLAGGSGSGDYSTRQVEEGTFTLPVAPTKPYNNFTGWKDSNTGIVYQAGTSTTINKAVQFTAQWTAQKITFVFTDPGWSAALNTVKMQAIGSNGDYAQSNSLTKSNSRYTYSVDLNATNGDVIAIKLTFKQSGNTWTAYSTGGYADFKPDETYTLTYSDWDNANWNTGIATFSMTIKNSSNQTVTQTTEKNIKHIVRVNFNGNMATLKIQYQNVTGSAKGFYYYDCSNGNSNPDYIGSVTTVNDTDSSFVFILTEANGSWTNQTNNITCTWSSGKTSRYTIYAQSVSGRVTAIVEVMNCSLSAPNNNAGLVEG